MTRVLFQTALNRYQAGELEQTAILCQQILQQQAGHLSTLNLLGQVYLDQRLFQQAHEIFMLALNQTAGNNDPYLWNGLGQAEEGLGSQSEAIQHYRQAIAIAPHCLEAILNLGLLLQNLSAWDEALACYQQASAFEPDATDILSNIGSVYMSLDKPQEAISVFQQALEIDPAYLNAGFNLALAYRKQEQPLLAKHQLELLLGHHPQFAEAYFQLGLIAKQAGDHEQELEYYRQTVQADPTHRLAYMRIGVLTSLRGQLAQAQTAYQALQTMEPYNALWPLRLASLLPDIAPDSQSMDQYRAQIESTLSILEQNEAVFDLVYLDESSPLPPYCFLYHGKDDLNLRRRLAGFLAKRMNSNDAYETPLGNEKTDKCKIRVGFYCSAHREYAFWTLQGNYLRYLDPEQFEVVVLGWEKTLPFITERLPSDSLVQFIYMPVEIQACVETVRQAQLDILHVFEVGSDPLNYLLPFYRMAPVQYTSWGILSTSGIANMDYYLSSRWFEPEDGQAHYSEKLVKLNSQIACFEKPDIPPNLKNRQELNLPLDRRLYGCPHNIIKLHPDFDAYLLEILQRDEAASIVLVQSTRPHNNTALLQRLKYSLGDCFDRIVLLPHLNWHDYLSLLEVCDVLLDPIYFGGGITSYDAFAIGTPVITQPTSLMRGRITAGMYAIMNIDETVANSQGDYVSLCLRIAQDKTLRKALKQKILTQNHRLYADRQVINELASFFKQAVLSPLNTG